LFGSGWIYAKRATPAIIRKFEKYRSVLSGKAGPPSKHPTNKPPIRLRKNIGIEKGPEKTIGHSEKNMGEKIQLPKINRRRNRFKGVKGYGEKTRQSKKDAFRKGFPAATGEWFPTSGFIITIPSRDGGGAGTLKRRTFFKLSMKCFIIFPSMMFDFERY